MWYEGMSGECWENKDSGNGFFSHLQDLGPVSKVDLTARQLVCLRRAPLTSSTVQRATWFAWTLDTPGSSLQCCCLPRGSFWRGLADREDMKMDCCSVFECLVVYSEKKKKKDRWSKEWDLSRTALRTEGQSQINCKHGGKRTLDAGHVTLQEGFPSMVNPTAVSKQLSQETYGIM